MNFRYEIATAASGFAMTKIQLVYFSSKLSMSITFVTTNQKFRKSFRLSGLLHIGKAIYSAVLAF